MSTSPSPLTRVLIVCVALLCSTPALGQSLSVWPSPQAVTPDDDGRFEVSLVVSNTSLEMARDVVVVDGLAQGATLVSSIPEAKVQGGQLLWALGDIAPGESGRVVLSLEGGLNTGPEVTARLGGVLRRHLGQAAREADFAPDVLPFLNPTPDANAADAEVLAVVARHGGDVDALQRLVTERVRYEAYAGSLRGARGTLWGGAGNAWDQASLLVALMRASGIPARYANATVSDDAAQTLIGSMFPPQKNLIESENRDPDLVAAQLADPQWRRDNLPSDTLTAFTDLTDPAVIRDRLFPDPRQDARLLAWARDHVWAQIFIDGVWVDVDPTGLTERPTPEAIFTEIDADRRHTLHVMVSAEMYNPLFGTAANSPSVSQLEATLNTVDLVGQPLGLTFGVVSETRAGLIIGVIENKYTPLLQLGERTVASGSTFTEIFTNFPGGQSVLTGLTLDIEVSSPGEAPRVFQHAIMDRLGAAVRNIGEDDVVLDIGEGIDGTPALNRSHWTTIHAASSKTVPRAARGPELRADQGEAFYRRVLKDDLDALVEAFGPEEAIGAENAPLMERYLDHLARYQKDFASYTGLAFLADSDGFEAQVARRAAVLSYPSRPRLVVSEFRGTADLPGPAMNILDDEPEVWQRPGQQIADVLRFRTMRGIILRDVESNTVSAVLAEGQTVISWQTVLAKADEQAIQMWFISPDNHTDLYRMSLEPNVLARLRERLAEGKLLYVPERPVLFDDEPQMRWLVYDGLTGAVGVENAQGWNDVVFSAGKEVSTASLGAGLGGLTGGLLGPLVAFGEAFNVGKLKTKSFSNVGVAVAAGAAGLDGSIKLIMGRSITGGILAGNGALSFTAAYFISLGVSFVASYKGAAEIIKEMLGLDPAISPGAPMGLLESRNLGPFNTVDALLEAPSQGPVRSPSGAGPWSVAGAIAATWESGESVLPGGVLSGDARIERGGEPVSEGPFEAQIETVFADGPGELSWEGSLTHDGTRAAGTSEVCSATLNGSLRFFGTLAPNDTPEWHTIQTGASLSFAGRGALALPASVTTRFEGASLASTNTAWGGVTGTLTFSPQPTLDVVVGSSVHLEGAPEDVLSMGRGQTLSVPLGAEFSGEGPVFLRAEAPEGWRADFESGALHLRAAPGAPAGVHEVHVWATADAQPGVDAGAVLEVSIEDGAPAVEVTLEHTPDFSEYHEALDSRPVPLTFLGQLTNTGPETATFTLQAEVPDGFDATLGLTEVTLAAGESARLGVNLKPPFPLPAPGADVEVRLLVNAEGVEAEDSATIPFPAVWAPRLTFAPSTLRLDPGAEGVIEVTVEALGNAPGDILFRPQNQTGRLQIEGMPETLGLVPGESQTFEVRVRAQEDAVVGLTYQGSFEMLRTELDVWLGDAGFDVEIVGPESNQALCAAEVAEELGDPAMVSAWLAVADRTERAAFRCRDVAVFNLKKTLENAVAALSDPAYAEVAAELRAFGEALIDEVGCETLDLAALAEIIGRVKAVMEAVRDHDFRLTLTPAGTFAQPGDEVSLALTVVRLGAEDTTLDLAIEGLEGAVQSPVTPDVLLEDLSVVLQVPDQGRHVVTVTATVSGAPQLRREVRAVVIAREAWIEVAHVGADPGFAVPGARLEVIVDLFNILNAPIDLEADAQVLRPDDSVLWQSEAPVPLHLTTTLGTQRFALGRAETFGEDPGHYRVRVQLRPVGGGEIVPGGEGEGVAFIGQPFEWAHAVEPPLLPPGDITARGRTVLTPRDLEPAPGLGALEALELLSAEAEGPNGLFVDSDGSIFFSSFGTRRSSDLPGFVAGTALGRVSPFGAVEEVAQIPTSPTGVAMGPDGAIYVCNVGNPERVTRIDPDTSETSVYWDFQANPPEGGGAGENPISLVFDAEGNLYLTELVEPALFVTFPGERIYKLTPDDNDDGEADRAMTFVTGFESPNHMILDPRTQDLLVSDARQRIVRVNTVGEPVLTDLITGVENVQGLWIDADGRLFVLNDNTGELQMWLTGVEGGQTVVESGPIVLGGGLQERYNLVGSPDGHLITADPDDDFIIRVFFAPPSPPRVLSLALTQRLNAASALFETALPEGAQRQGDALLWDLDFGGDAETESYEVDHALTDLAPGQVVELSSGTTLRYLDGDATLEVELPAQRALVGHMLAAEPDQLDLNRSAPRTVTITLQNLRDEADTWTLTTLPGAPGIETTHETTFELAPGEVRTVEVTVLALSEAVLGESRLTFMAESQLGGSDEVVVVLDVTRWASLPTSNPHIRRFVEGSRCVGPSLLPRSLPTRTTGAWGLSLQRGACPR